MNARVTESQFQDQVSDLARKCGSWVMHHRVSLGTQAGWPDLTLIRGTELLFMELKTQTGRVSAAQADVHERLIVAGQRVFVFRPSDFDEIHDLLRRRGGGR